MGTKSRAFAVNFSPKYFPLDYYTFRQFFLSLQCAMCVCVCVSVCMYIHLPPISVYMFAINQYRFTKAGDLQFSPAKYIGSLV